MNIGEKLFGIKAGKIYLQKHENPAWNNAYHVNFSSMNLLDYLGPWHEKKWLGTLHNKFNWVVSDKQYLKHFLSAFFDCEGSVAFRKTTSNRQLIRVDFATAQEPIKKFLVKSFKKYNITVQKQQRGVLSSNFENNKKLAHLLYSHIDYKRKLLNQIKDCEIILSGYSHAQYELAMKMKKHKVPMKTIARTLNLNYHVLSCWFYQGFKPGNKYTIISKAKAKKILASQKQKEKKMVCLALKEINKRSLK